MLRYILNRSRIMIRHDTISISKSHSILINFFDFINWTSCKDTKYYCPLKYQLCYHFKKQFCNKKSFLFLYFVNLDKNKTWNNNTPPLSCRRQITLQKHLWNLPISNPKADVHNINAQTKFRENPFNGNSVIVVYAKLLFYDTASL